MSPSELVKGRFVLSSDRRIHARANRLLTADCWPRSAPRQSGWGVLRRSEGLPLLQQPTMWARAADERGHVGQSSERRQACRTGPGRRRPAPGGVMRWVRGAAREGGEEA